MEKRCSGPCGQTKPLEAFSRMTRAKDGHQAWCKECMRDRKRQLRKTVGAKQQRAHTLKHLYGLSVEQWDKMLIEQSGLCALCDEPMRNPHVDHSHTTGEVRGLLCLRCNTMLGNVELITISRIEAYLGVDFLAESRQGNILVWESVYLRFLSSSYN